MLCNKCGTDNQAGTRFCSYCGAELTEQAQQEQKQADFQQPTYQQSYQPADYQQQNYQQNNYQQPIYQQPYQQQYYQQPMYQQPMTNVDPGKGFAIASLVLGIVSFLCFPAITGVLGIIFGGIARSKGSRSPMAIAGIVCGVIGIILWIILIVLQIALGWDLYQFAG